MAKSQSKSQAVSTEAGFPANIPSLALWQLVGKVDQKDVQKCLEESLWCLRAGGTNAAMVMGWAAVMLRMRSVYDRLPATVREMYQARHYHRQNPLHDSDFLKIWGEIGLFDLKKNNETTEKHGVLSQFLKLRGKCAHTWQDIDPQKVTGFLLRCGNWFASPPVTEFRFSDCSTAANLVRDTGLNKLTALEIEGVLDFVQDTQMSQLADKLLGYYYSSTLPEPTAESNVRSGDGVHSEDSTVCEKSAFTDQSRARSNLSGLWNATYLRLADLERIMLLDGLTFKFAEAVGSHPFDLGERFKLVARDTDEFQSFDRWRLSDLASLVVWRREMSPDKYRDLFYSCFAAGSADFAGLSNLLRGEIVDHAPDEHRKTLEEALFQ